MAALAILALAGSTSTLAILWTGSRAEADDAGDQRDSLAARLDTTEDALSAANTDLDDARARIADLDGEVAGLQDQVADLERQLAIAEESARRAEISDSVATSIGFDLGYGADPPLNDAEAACIGRRFYEKVGLELLLELQFADEPTSAQIGRITEGVISAAGGCDIEFTRLLG